MNAYISRLIIGIAVLAVGAALLLDALNIVNTSSLLSNWWPSLIILGGVAMLVSDTRNYLWALLVIIVGVATQLRVLGYADVNPWQVFWPLALIMIGLSIIFRRPTLSRRASETDSDDIVAILGGSDQKNMSDDFSGSKITAILGGTKLDLRKATIKKSATINLFALMGGVELVVPRGVIVKNRTNAILGGIENKTDQDITKDSPTLTITGDVILGGVEIKN